MPIKLIVSHNKKTKRRTIGYAQYATWDPLKSLPTPSHPDFENLYGTILDIRKKAVTAAFMEITDLDDALAYLLDISAKPSVFTFEDYFKKQIAIMRKLGRDGNADAYQWAINSFKTFAPGVKLVDITKDIINAYKNAKLTEVKTVTVRNYVAELRAVYRKAVNDPAVRLVDNGAFDGCMDGLYVKRRRARNRYISKKRMAKLINTLKGDHELTGCELRSIKLGILSFYLAGLNLKDIYYLKWKQFYDGRVLLVRSKTQRFGDEFDVRVFPEAQEIIDAYCEAGGEYVFPWRKDALGYKNFRGNLNNDLKEVQKKLSIKLKPIDKPLSSGVFRHTFSTLSKFAGVHPDIIRELMGHERNDIDTVYYDKYPEKKRDKAHKKVIRLK